MGQDESCPRYRIAGLNDLMFQCKAIIIIEAQRVGMVADFVTLFSCCRYGGYGATITCREGYIPVQLCTSGRDPDCSGFYTKLRCCRETVGAGVYLWSRLFTSAFWK